MKKQIFNPYLPLEEYVPDAEPHVFDGRVYVYGSHVGSGDGERFIRELQNGTLIGYRNFDFTGVCGFSVTMMCEKEAVLRVYQGLPAEYTSVQETPAEPIAEILIPASDQWISQGQTIPFAAGDHPLYLVYQGDGEGKLLEIAFSKAE